MAFEKGISGNPKGRPKGQVNLITKSVRDILADAHAINFERLCQDLDKMTLRERMQFNRDILPYIAPKLSNIQIKEDALTYEELVKQYQLEESIKLLSTEDLKSLLQMDD
jgi:hypothetical protein|tara:strand:- start:3413 stop:3742 length:330 start_codon:yes stop_codon:yes gene_type:complete